MKTKYYFLSALFAVAICAVNWYFNGWDYHMLVALIIFAFLVYWQRPKVDISVKEKWGEHEISKSDIVWKLPRKMCSHEGPDSRPFLEEHGFTILGIVDEMLYFVEPPKDWYEQGQSGIWSKIKNEIGITKFFRYHKSDTMNLNSSDYHAFLFTEKEML